METQQLQDDKQIQTFQENYDSSIPDDILFPEFILQRIVHWKGRVACEDTETKESLTYIQIREDSYALATGLQTKLNLQHGDNVAIILPNCVQYPVAVFAVMLCGASASLVNPAQTISELEHSIKLTNPKAWIGTEDFVAKYSKIYEGCPDKPTFVLLSNNSTEDHLSVAKLKSIGYSEQSYKRPVIRPREDAALILFSSGTTGVPKGVILTHTNLMVSRRQNEELAKHVRRKNPLPNGTTMPTNECLGAILPFFHAMGISGVFEYLVGGFRFVIIPNFTFHRFLQAVEDHKITIVALVPAIAVQLAKQPVEKLYDLSSLKVIRCGASALSAETIDVLQRKLKCIVYQGYGMTEATIRTHGNYKGINREGSIGTVMPFCECKVIDRETNEILGPHQEGEICVRGPLVMKGYIGDAKATGATIDPEGWLHTGDVGYYDKDGYFFITDRMKELIKYKGFQVSPTELEKILLTHTDVMDVAVAPVVEESAGEVPRAYVVKRPGSSVTGEELAIFVADKVSSYKRLRGGVVFIDAVPKTSTGKIIRRALKDKVASKL